MSTDSSAALRPYLELFHDFIGERVDADTFSERFVRPYLSDPTPWDASVFDVLDRVFSDADAFVADDATRAEVIGAIDAVQLRSSVSRALAEFGDVR